MEAKKKYQSGSYVEIVQRDSKGQDPQVVATCTLKGKDKVACAGNKQLVKALTTEGAYLTLGTGEQKLCRPKDGALFLMALGSQFDNPSGLCATSIKPPKAKNKKVLT